MPKFSKPLVRRAELGDADALAALGQALNVQQGDPSTNFTAETVRRDGFGEAPKFEAWVAELDGKAVGARQARAGSSDIGRAQTSRRDRR